MENIPKGKLSKTHRDSLSKMLGTLASFPKCAFGFIFLVHSFSLDFETYISVKKITA